MMKSYSTVLQEANEKYGVGEPTVGSLRDLGDILDEYLTYRAERMQNNNLMNDPRYGYELRTEVTKVFQNISQVVQDYIHLKQQKANAITKEGFLAQPKSSQNHMSPTQPPANDYNHKTNKPGQGIRGSAQATVNKSSVSSTYPGNKKISQPAKRKPSSSRPVQLQPPITASLSEVVNGMSSKLEKRNNKQGYSMSPSLLKPGISKTNMKKTPTGKLLEEGKSQDTASRMSIPTTTKSLLPGELGESLEGMSNMSFAVSVNLDSQINLDSQLMGANDIPNERSVFSLADLDHNNAQDDDFSLFGNKSVIPPSEISLSSILGAGTNSLLGRGTMSNMLADIEVTKDRNKLDSTNSLPTHKEAVAKNCIQPVNPVSPMQEKTVQKPQTRTAQNNKKSNSARGNVEPTSSTKKKKRRIAPSVIAAPIASPAFGTKSTIGVQKKTIPKQGATAKANNTPQNTPSKATFQPSKLPTSLDVDSLLNKVSYGK
mmetsp:Transcript_43043/g.69128  ORF Transcript_43043/g.69128 Transcript_43043/m.69128 type:complete len:486 (-) Transcript_43043:565-2022(-)